MNKKINVAIIDDCENFVNLLGQYLKDIDYVKIVGIAHNEKDALKLLTQLEIDIVLLDIELGGTTAFEILSKLPHHNFSIIFITAHEHYALEAIKFSAVDYLLKPFHKEDLFSAIEKASRNLPHQLISLNVLLNNLKQTSRDKLKIGLNTSECITFLYIEEIIYCKSDGNYTNFHLNDGSNLFVSSPIKKYDEMLSHLGFFRVHKSFLINLKHVKTYSKTNNQVLMTDASVIDVSRRKKELFLKAILSN